MNKFNTVVVQWLSPVQLFATPWTEAGQASLVLYYLSEFAQAYIHLRELTLRQVGKESRALKEEKRVSILFYMSEAFFIPFFSVIKLLPHKALSAWSLISGPKAKLSSSEIGTLTPFSISYHYHQPGQKDSYQVLLTSSHTVKLKGSNSWINFPSKKVPAVD